MRSFDMALFQLTELELNKQLKKFNFQKNSNEADALPADNDRLAYWLKKKRDLKQLAHDNSDKLGWGQNIILLKRAEYLRKVDVEIEYLKELLTGETPLSKLKTTDGREKNSTSKAQKGIAQNFLNENRDVWKDEFNGNQDPFVKEKVIPHIIKELGIYKVECLSSRQICQSLNWNKPKKHK